MNRKILKTAFTMDDLDIEELKQLNMGVEIQDFTEPNLSPQEKIDTVAFYKEKFKGFTGIRSLHGPFLDLKPASPDKDIREVSFQKYLETIQIAHELEMDYIVFHSQINPYIKGPFMEELNNKQSRDAWVKLLENIPEYQGTILIENIFEEGPRILKELIQTINLPNIKINLDIGHAKLGKVSLEKWISELKDHIAYIHIHSNDGVSDSHNPLNEEEVKHLYYLLDKYHLNPTLALEYKIDCLKEEIKKY